MKKFAMALLATAVAVPMMFAADTPQTDTTQTTKSTKKHKKSKKTTASIATTSAAAVQ